MFLVQKRLHAWNERRREYVPPISPMLTTPSCDQRKYNHHAYTSRHSPEPGDCVHTYNI